MRQRQRYVTGIGVSLAMHGLLVLLWQLAQPQHVEDDTSSSSMQVRLLRAPREQAAIAAAQPEARPVPDVPPPSAPSPSARDMLNRAMLAVGGIARALRRENPQRGIVAPIETAMKLEKGTSGAVPRRPDRRPE